MNTLLDTLIVQAVKKHSLAKYTLRQGNFLHTHVGPSSTVTFALEKRIRIIYGYTVSYFARVTDILELNTKSKADFSNDQLYINTTTTQMFISTGSEHFGGNLEFNTTTSGLTIAFINVHYVDITPIGTMLRG